MSLRTSIYRLVWLLSPCCIRHRLGEVTSICTSGSSPYTLARDPEISPSLAEKGARPVSAEENEALVRRYFESGYQEAHEGNLDVVHQYFADHFHDHTSMHPDHPGVHGVKELISDSSQANPDLRMEVLDIAAEGDIVFVHWRATATHEGQHQLYKHVRDIEPTGEEGTASGITLYRIEGGKFVEMWNYHNVLEYALEHGMAGAPGGGS